MPVRIRDPVHEPPTIQWLSGARRWMEPWPQDRIPDEPAHFTWGD